MTIKYYDAIVVGGGFGGITQLFKLEEAGYSVHAFERGSFLGTVWHHNRYPGAIVRNTNISTLIKRYCQDSNSVVIHVWLRISHPKKLKSNLIKKMVEFWGNFSDLFIDIQTSPPMTTGEIRVKKGSKVQGKIIGSR
jgi:hypothetical protein